MASQRHELADRLLTIVHDLPDDKVMEVLDFASFLHGKYGERTPSRGSAESILRTLERVGPLEFEPGELDALLTEIEQARDLDLEEHG